MSAITDEAVRAGLIGARSRPASEYDAMRAALESAQPFMGATPTREALTMAIRAKGHVRYAWQAAELADAVLALIGGDAKS